jgi:hypothetical protein
MIEAAPRSGNTVPGAPAPHTIEFFSIQLSPTSEGRYFVAVEATICEAECELSQMALGYHGAASLDDALELIRTAITAH